MTKSNTVKRPRKKASQQIEIAEPTKKMTLRIGAVYKVGSLVFWATIDKATITDDSSAVSVRLVNLRNAIALPTLSGTMFVGGEVEVKLESSLIDYAALEKVAETLSSYVRRQ